MAGNPIITKLKFVLILFVIGAFFNLSFGQQAPDYPVSYRVFTPFIFNPAIAGSKDYFGIELQAGKYGESNSQVLSGNSRLKKPDKGYFSSAGAPEFTNIGIGGFIFDDFSDLSRNIGIGASGSYHFQLDKNSLSFLSVGISGKAIYNKYPGNPDLGEPAKNTFLPDFDAGVYYYSTSLFAGVSATNLLGNSEKPDSLGSYSIPVSRQYFLQIGYKLVLSRSLDLLLEPSLIVNADDSLSGDIANMFKPALKFYAGNFCLGTYFNNFDKISFFFQYKYPRVYLGTYFELPYNSPFFKQPILAEFALGINLSAFKSGFPRRNHW